MAAMALTTKKFDRVSVRCVCCNARQVSDSLSSISAEASIRLGFVA
jgi:hypothetical protein